MKKVLFIGNVAGKKMTGSFSRAAISAAHELGLEYHSVANRDNSTRDQILSDQAKFGITMHHADISRSPFSKSNIRAFGQIVKIIREHDIDYIHCNTPVGGILGRLAGKKCKVKKIIYQAHGFHFYKGASKKNWFLYYPVERWLAHYTDALITINSEDFELARTKLKLRNNGKVYYVPGVGIDLSQYNIETKFRSEKRSKLGLNDGDLALISMGDLIERKNYDTAIRAIAAANNSALQYFICGTGPEEEKLKNLAQSLGVSDRIHFLGFRSDVKELLAASDIFLFTSKQEGLPRSMMEAMASGLPCVASRIRGNTDLLENTDGGYLCDADDISEYAEKLKLLAADAELRERMGRSNLITIKKFSIETVNEEIRKIYNKELFGVEI